VQSELNAASRQYWWDFITTNQCTIMYYNSICLYNTYMVLHVSTFLCHYQGVLHTRPAN